MSFIKLKNNDSLINLDGFRFIQKVDDMSDKAAVRRWIKITFASGEVKELFYGKDDEYRSNETLNKARRDDDFDSIFSHLTTNP